METAVPELGKPVPSRFISGFREGSACLLYEHNLLPSVSSLCNSTRAPRLCCCCGSVVSGSVTSWTVAHQAPLSLGFPRHKYWSGLPFPTPGNLPDTEIECLSLVSCVLAGSFFTTAPPEKPCCCNQALMVWKQCDQCLALPWTPSAVLFQSSLCNFNQNTV